jgi:hypothetical protein
MQLNGPLTLILSPSDGERKHLPVGKTSHRLVDRRLLLILFSLFQGEKIKMRGG